jgi:biopolymer transport protein ExbD
MAEINVTPFVDVVLVLLIIFMITAHVFESGIEVNVPKTKTVKETTKDFPIVSLSKSGELVLGRDPVNVNSLGDTIHTKYPGQSSVYLRADSEAPWGTAAQVMSSLGTAKFNVIVVTQPDDTKTGRR